MAKYKVYNRLLEIRLNQGYRFQKDFAEKLGIERQEYSKLENNKKSLSITKAFILAEKLNIKVDELCYLQKIEKDTPEK